MSRIYKPFTGYSVQDVAAGGTKSFVSFERLIPAIKEAIHLKPNETIIGFVADEDGILVSIKT